MANYSEKEIEGVRNSLIEKLEEDVRAVLRRRREKNQSTTSFPVTETFCEQGAAYVEFNDFSVEFPRLILARKGQALALHLYAGSIKDIAGLELLEDFGVYSVEGVEAAVAAYFSRVRRIIESTE